MTFSPNISPEEEKIDWNKSAREIFNKVRGMNPFPVAHTLWNGERFKIYESKVADEIVNNSDNPLQAGQIVEKQKNH